MTGQLELVMTDAYNTRSLSVTRAPWRHREGASYRAVGRMIVHAPIQTRV